MAIVLPEHKAIALRLRDPSKVCSLLPHKRVQTDKGEFVVMPHTLDTYKVLVNLGFDLAGMHPIHHHYVPPKVRGVHPLRADQLTTAEVLSSNSRAYCLSTPRVGKTASALAAIDFLIKQGKARSALIIAPNSCLSSVWTSEAFGMFPQWATVTLTGDKKARLKKLDRQHTLYVINPDGVKVILPELVRAVTEGDIDIIVIDELTYYANRTSDRWKAASHLVSKAKYVWGLTGTPGGPEQVYGQARLITPASVPASFTAWQGMTMYPAQSGLVGGRNTVFKWAPKPGHEELIKKALSPSVRFDKRDILDLPPVQYLEYDVDMSAAQTQTYELLRKDMMALVSSGQIITADNAAVLRGKLLQVSAGVVRADEGHVVLDISARVEQLVQIIREAEFKVVVFVPYIQVLLELQRQLSVHWSVAVVYGDVTGANRDKVFRDFQNSDDPHVLLAHPATVSFGVELAAADTIVFWGPPVSGSFVYQQAVERIQSVQQKSKSPAVVHITSSLAERQAFYNLKAGVSINESIIEAFRDLVQN